MIPDLLDKPAFFALGVYHYLHDGGWTPGKRGLAHTAVFLMLLVIVGLWKSSPKWIAVAVGTATHLLLDVCSKATGWLHWNADVFVVLFWPLLGWEFPVLPYGIHGVAALALELIGAALLMIQVVVRRGRK